MTRLVRFSNNAVSKLASAITAASTTISLQAGDGSKFPTLTGTQFFMATLVKSDGTTEVVKVTARTGDTLTVVRAAEAVGGVQTAYAFSSGDRIEHRLTAKAIGDELDRLDQAALIAAQNKTANYTVTAADITSLIRMNTAGGNLTVTLPDITTLTDDFDVIVAKVSADNNVVTIARSGTDTINGATSYALTNQWQGAWLTADRSTGTWTVIASGGGGVKSNVDTFTGTGTPGPFTLSGDPGIKENTAVYVGGVYQQKSTYTLTGTSLTVGGNVPAGVSVEVVWAAPLQVGITSANQTTASDGASGSLFTTVQGFITRLLSSAGSAIVGFIQAGTGAVARWVQDKLREQLSVKDFGAKGDWNGSTGTDDTAAIQAAINAASKAGFTEVFVPTGAYLFSKLYLYYDATFNPGFNPAMMGRVRLVGSGQINHAEANTWPANGWTGSLLVSNITTGDAIMVSPASADGGAYPSRQTVFENLSVVANTTGFVIRHHCAISSQMRNVTVLQLNAAGSGVYWHSGWFTLWDNVWVTNRQTSGQTGVGVDFGATLFAGSFRFSNCTFEQFRDGFQVNDSVQSVSMLFDGICTFQGNARDGLQINAPIRSLVLDTPYFEFNGRSHARCTLSSGGIQSLSIRGGFALGGTTSATTMTGPMFYLRNVTNWSIDGLAVFRPWTDIVDVGRFAANGTVGAIKNTCVDASDNTPGSVIYLARVDDQRAMPIFEGNTLIGSTQVKEFDAATYFLNSKQGAIGIESFAWQGPVQRKSLGLNGTDYLQSGTTAPLVIYNVQGGGSFVALPGAPGDGRKIVIASQTASVASTLIRQADAATNLLTLNAGQAVECYFEPTANKWVAVGPVSFAGL